VCVDNTLQNSRQRKPETEPRPSRVVRKHEVRHIVIIKALYSEVRLDSNRETNGHGQGSGLSGEAESRVAGFRFAPLAAAN
jgi:hypothetical protein